MYHGEKDSSESRNNNILKSKRYMLKSVSKNGLSLWNLESNRFVFESKNLLRKDKYHQKAKRKRR